MGFVCFCIFPRLWDIAIYPSWDMGYLYIYLSLDKILCTHTSTHGDIMRIHTSNVTSLDMGISRVNIPLSLEMGISHVHISLFEHIDHCIMIHKTHVIY